MGKMKNMHVHCNITKKLPNFHNNVGTLSGLSCLS